MKTDFLSCKFTTIYSALSCLQSEPSDLELVKTVHALKCHYDMNNPWQ